MGYSNGQKFSTPDKDQDEHLNKNCAKSYGGAWWHKACHLANLNAFKYGRVHGASGINWYHFGNNKKKRVPMKRTSMKIRPHSLA